MAERGRVLKKTKPGREAGLCSPSQEKAKLIYSVTKEVAMVNSGSVMTLEERRKVRRERAMSCANSFISAGRTCSGCPNFAICGIGTYNALRLRALLDVIDPSGLNITTIELGPIGQRS